MRVSVWEQKSVVGETLVPIITDEQGNYTAETVKSVAVMEAETFTCPDNLRFYSKELSNLTPGLYKITVETLKDGNVTASTQIMTSLKAAEAAASVSFDGQQSGALQWLQNFFKNVFGG